MPQEESKRGAHFAKGTAPQAPAPEAASFDNEIRNAWSAAADPGETAVYLRAAGAGTALPRTVLSSTRPDETAVFLAAAQSSASVTPVVSEAPRVLRPDETAVFLMAAQGKSAPQSTPAARSSKPAAHDDDEVRPIPSRAWPSTVMMTGTLCRFLPEPSPPKKLTRCLATMPYSMMMPYPVTTCRTAMTPHLLMTPFWLTIPLR